MISTYYTSCTIGLEGLSIVALVSSLLFDLGGGIEEVVGLLRGGGGLGSPPLFLQHREQTATGEAVEGQGFEGS